MLEKLAQILDRDASITQQAKLIEENKGQLLKQKAALTAQVKQASTNAKAWETASNQCLDTLKGLGDVRNWAELMEHDIEVLERCVALKTAGGGAGS
jgi:hypothetical protein